MRELVVLPFVPVTATVLTSFARRLSSSGYILSAMRPGIAVPPRCRMRETRRSALHTSIANTALKFIGGLLAVKDSCENNLYSITQVYSLRQEICLSEYTC